VSGERRKPEHRLAVASPPGPLRPVPKPGPEQWVPLLQGGGLAAAMALIASNRLDRPPWLNAFLVLAAGSAFVAAGYFSAKRK
jgi:hypothetical protein